MQKWLKWGEKLQETNNAESAFTQTLYIPCDAHWVHFLVCKRTKQREPEDVLEKISVLRRATTPPQVMCRSSFPCSL